ncbi:MAG: hypothetical protein JWP87_6452, partial [Labilithrix sp.]|nr:hypothetical protein [Labilithrix sp.]
SLPSYTATLRNLEAKETQQLNAKYVDAITTTQTVTNSWNIGAELGVKAGWKASVEVPIFKTIAESSIEFKTYGGYQNSKTDTDTRTQTWECGTQVSVPPGCVYDAHFAVTKVRTDSQYRVKVTAKPYTASLSGFMRDASLPDDGYRALGSDPGCFFKKPGHIAERDVTHQRDKTGQSCLWGKVEEKDATFGGHDEKGKPFYQDIADQRHNDSGNWYWFMMAEGKDYIGQVMTESTDWPPRPGVPDVDVVIDRLSDDKLYHFSLFPLQTSLEDDVHCEITISKNPESLPECAQPAPGKTEIAPKPAPKNSSLFSPITVVGDP